MERCLDGVRETNELSHERRLAKAKNGIHGVRGLSSQQHTKCHPLVWDMLKLKSPRLATAHQLTTALCVGWLCGGCHQLERLVFSPNAKCTRRVSTDECRVAVRHLIPTLQALDGIAFTAAEVAAAAKGAPACARKPRWGGGGAADAAMLASARRPPLQVRTLRHFSETSRALSAPSAPCAHAHFYCKTHSPAPRTLSF
jgi:hypothetical protein